MNKICHKKYHYHDNARIHTAKIVKSSMKRLGIIPINGIPYTSELNLSEYVINMFKQKL